jgi:hypothetical protein
MNKIPGLKEVYFRRLFDQTDYDYFLKKAGSREKLKERIFTVTTTGKSGPELLEALKVSGARIDTQTTAFLRSDEFKKSEKGEIVHMLCLSILEVTSHPSYRPEKYGNNYLFSEVASIAKRLGLAFLPEESVVDLLLSGQMRNGMVGGTALTEKALNVTERNTFLSATQNGYSELDCHEYGPTTLPGSINKIFVRLIP